MITNMLMCEREVVYLTQHIKSWSSIAVVYVAQLVDAFVRCVRFYNQKDTGLNPTRNYSYLFITFCLTFHEMTIVNQPIKQ